MLGYNSVMDDFWPENSPLSEKGLTAEQRRTLEGLLFILNHESDTSLRLKAVRALSQYEEITALRTLAELALYDDDKAVRVAARQELDSLFGEESDSFLESIRLELEGEEGGEEEEENEMETFSSSPMDDPSPISGSSAPVVQEERTPVWIWAAIFVLIAGFLFVFIFR